jgi:hypothetical protein
MQLGWMDGIVEMFSFRLHTREQQLIALAAFGALF